MRGGGAPARAGGPCQPRGQPQPREPRTEPSRGAGAAPGSAVAANARLCWESRSPPVTSLPAAPSVPAHRSSSAVRGVKYA